jgi:hypothetical protein
MLTPGPLLLLRGHLFFSAFSNPAHLAPVQVIGQMGHLRRRKDCHNRQQGLDEVCRTSWFSSVLLLEFLSAA